VLYYVASLDWVMAFHSGDWASFSKKYSVDVSNVSNPECYHCWPEVPYAWSQFGPWLVGFGVAVIGYSWWRPLKK
jgi:hypothetical protein